MPSSHSPERCSDSRSVWISRRMPDALHQASGGIVVGEAVGRDATQPQINEAQTDQLTDGLGGVPVAGVVGVQHPPQLGLYAGGLLHDLGLGPRVVDLEHQLTDDLCRPARSRGSWPGWWGPRDAGGTPPASPVHA